VAERRNRTLMDMVRSMLIYFTSLISLRMQALKTTIHIINLVPSKSGTKTLYKIWTGRKPTLNYLHVWGCPIEAKLFNPSIEKLEPKTVSCHFIGYLDKSKGFRFYYPDRYTKIVETRHTVFLEDEVIRRSTVPQEIQEAGICAHFDGRRTIFLSTCCCYTHSTRQYGYRTVVDSLVHMAATPIIGSLMTQIDENEEPIFRNLLTIMRSNNNLLYKMCHIMNLLEDLRGPED
jgi:hypothetical protein